MSSAIRDDQPYGASVDDDEPPFDVNDDELVDVSDQQTDDVIEKAKNVRFEIKKASIDIWEDDKVSPKNWFARKLSLEVAVVDGIDIDGDLKYAGKRFFPRLTYRLNTADYPEKFKSDWWKQKARAPFKQFCGKGLGLDVSAIRINDQFLVDLVGQEFIANILKSEKRAKDANGDYQGTGEYENVLTDFKKAS